MRLIPVFPALFLLICGCAEEYTGRPPVTDGVYYPMTVAAEPQSGLLFIVNSNFDLAYRFASVVAVKLDSHGFVGTAAFTESFPGDLALAAFGKPERRFAYLPVRGNNSLSWFELEGQGDGSKLLCGDGENEGQRCQGDHVVTGGTLAGPEGEPVEAKIGSDPFGLAVIPPPEEGDPSLLAVGAMGSGRISLFELEEDGFPLLVDQASLSSGLHTLAYDPFARILYASNKSVYVLHRLQLRQEEERYQLNQLSAVVLPAPFSTGQYARGLAFAAGGSLLLATYRNPPSLLVVSVGLDGGGSSNTVQAIPVGSKPGNVRVLPTGPGGSEVAYVACYGDDAVWAVDLDSRQVVDRIEVGAGPYDLTAVFTDELKRAYVSNFLGHSVSVIELDRSKTSFHQTIAEIP